MATFFLVTFFFFVTFFFLEAGFFRETFFRETFFRETFFRLAAFLLAFFLATTFFLDDFFADAFFLLTFRFVPAGFFRLTALAGAAFLRVARVFFRFLLAVILKFLPNRKARDYTPVVSTWKGIYDGFSTPVADTALKPRCGHFRRLRSWPDRVPSGPISEAETTLEAASTAALSRRRLLPTTIVLLAELHYTSPNFPGYGHLTT